jgi:hypothetical protein
MEAGKIKNFLVTLSRLLIGTSFLFFFFQIFETACEEHSIIVIADSVDVLFLAFFVVCSCKKAPLLLWCIIGLPSIVIKVLMLAVKFGLAHGDRIQPILASVIACVFYVACLALWVLTPANMNPPPVNFPRQWGDGPLPIVYL